MGRPWRRTCSLKRRHATRHGLETKPRVWCLALKKMCLTPMKAAHGRRFSLTHLRGRSCAKTASPKKVMADETAIYWEIQQCFANNKEVRTGNFPAGIWFGGKKYTVTTQDKTESDPPIQFVNMALKGEAKAGAGGGVTIAYHGGYLVCGFFKKPAQDRGHCNIAVTTYAATLA